jgi:hypothetical protein
VIEISGRQSVAGDKRVRNRVELGRNRRPMTASQLPFEIALELLA